MSFLQRLPRLKQCRSIMKGFTAAFVAINEADQQCWFAQPFLQVVEHGQIFRNEARFEDEILWWISRHRQFGGNHDIGSRASELIVGTGDLLEIAAQIADCRINLSETNLHPRNKVMRGAESGKNFAYFFSLPMTVRCS